MSFYVKARFEFGVSFLHSCRPWQAGVLWCVILTWQLVSSLDSVSCLHGGKPWQAGVLWCVILTWRLVASLDGVLCLRGGRPWQAGFTLLCNFGVATCF